MIDNSEEQQIIVVPFSVRNELAGPYKFVWEQGDDT